MILRPSKSQALSMIKNSASDYLELLSEFKTYDGGWLVWPDKLLTLKAQLNLDLYVTLYDDEKRINSCFALYLYDRDELQQQVEEEKLLTQTQKQQQLEVLLGEINDLTNDLFVQSELDEKLALEQFQTLSLEEQKNIMQKSQYLWLGILASLHNYFSVMVHGEKMTSLVPKAINGDDESYLKAVKIDRHLITTHPYFKSRYERAQSSGEIHFLQKLSARQSIPNLLSKIRYPGVYFIFSMLDVMSWLDDFTHEEILDICDEAKLDRWQNRIEDVNAITKQLKRYRQYQKSGGVSMHSN